MPIGLDDVAIAAATIIVGYYLDQQMMRGQEQRQATQTKIDTVFNAVKDIYNVSINDLQNVLNKYEVNLSDLRDASRGSARLARISKITRDAISRYPGFKDDVNSAIRSIQQGINSLSKEQGSLSAKVLNRGRVTNLDMASAIGNINSKINTELTSRGFKEDTTRESSNQINTQLMSMSRQDSNYFNYWLKQWKAAEQDNDRKKMSELWKQRPLRENGTEMFLDANGRPLKDPDNRFQEEEEKEETKGNN